jgi:hypothetical protein
MVMVWPRMCPDTSPVAATTAGRGGSLQDIFSSKRNMRREKRIIFYNMLKIGA